MSEGGRHHTSRTPPRSFVAGSSPVMIQLLPSTREKRDVRVHWSVEQTVARSRLLLLAAPNSHRRTASPVSVAIRRCL
nr:hypothetical protein Itr_chr12CG08420 [Ipomoea trifida]